MPRPALLRLLGALVAALAVIAGSVVALSPASTAAPHAARAETCHSFSQSTRSWIDWRVENISCEHAHAVGRTWAGSCGRSTSTVTPLTCSVPQTIDGAAVHFHCSNTKGAQSPAHYQVHCHDPHGRKASFIFYAHGF